MDITQALALFRVMVTSRQVDQLERELVNRGEVFFHVSGAGHEGSAALANHLIAEDYLHVHYRSKALCLARGYTTLRLFQCLHTKDDSHCRGRQMSAHLSDPSRNILSIPGPVGNAALQSVGVAAVIKEHAARPIVVSAIGDGSTQQGEFLEACGEASRDTLPVLFLIEDNGWAISTNTTGKTFYSVAGADANSFHGIDILYVDGRDPAAAHEAFAPIVAQIRADRKPRIVVLAVDRLSDHTNADDQRIYRSAAEIEAVAASGDPIRRMETYLLSQGVSAAQLDLIRQEVAAEIREAEEQAFQGGDPKPVKTAKATLAPQLTSRASEAAPQDEGPALAMKDALREVLKHQLASDPRVFLYGEDIEDPKGDVFGVTKGLSTAFPGRVRNSPLTESTIMGTCVGRALAGQRPVAFLQFADFMPLAFNQISLELATMWWRTNGDWTSPVIAMIPCGGYRPGLGPFHSHSLEAILAHTPGLDVMMPSNAADAAGMLNAAFASGRPTLFLYPKACLNDPTRVTTGKASKHFVPVGKARKERVGRDITLVGWGNTVKLCRQAAEALEQAEIEAEVIDLRWLSPWDEELVMSSVKKTSRLVVVHEDNHSCGVGAEIVATVAEKSPTAVAMRRVTRPDTFVPCNFSNQVDVLPSLSSVVEAAAELLDLEVAWPQQQKTVEKGIAVVHAVGSGPSDETVTIVELHVQPGAQVKAGETLAELEATKGVLELTSPISGTLETILAAAGETVAVGSALMKIRTAEAAGRKKPLVADPRTSPIIRRKNNEKPATILPMQRQWHRRDVGIGAVATARGGRVVLNDELLAHADGMTSDDIIRRTGIESRRWIAGGEDAITLGVKAATQALEMAELLVDDLDLVLCTTTTPLAVTPSMACKVLNGLSATSSEALVQAYDINAACSGYLYALQAGYDYLQSKPSGRVMIVTSEVLSPLLNPDDFDTAIIFGDAASATILYGEEHLDRFQVRVSRPDVSARGEDGSALSVPFMNEGFIRMQGRKVFIEAVRLMLSSLQRACQQDGISPDDLNVVVPHQANQRIIDAIQNRVNVSVFSNIRHVGNTSSTSIPLCLEELLPTLNQGDRVGLCVFGGGFTFGASILEVLQPRMYATRKAG